MHFVPPKGYAIIYNTVSSQTYMSEDIISELNIFTERCYASAVYAVVVCLSVCLSVYLSLTLRYCIKTAKHTITQTKPHDSPGF